MDIDFIVKKAEREAVSREELRYLLALEDESAKQKLFNKAYEIKLKHSGRKVYFRGLIEVSNRCSKDCYYCGIRKSNKEVNRYLMQEEDIIKAAHFAWKNRYGSIVLQSGERSDPFYIRFIDRIIKRIKEESNGELGVTLSLGEQKEETYKMWKESGAHRYLLRIEASNEQLYKKLHPSGHSFQRRKECLFMLKELGYQTGTGVMIKLPWQTYDDLVDDLLFFGEMDVDMIGMGPYIRSEHAPLAHLEEDAYPIREDSLSLALKMIAVTRIFLKDVNIASTTALQALHSRGREMGLKAGANIIMPNISDIHYKSNYQLYEGKPCLDENAEECSNSLENHILALGEEIGYGEWGDSAHFMNK